MTDKHFKIVTFLIGFILIGASFLLEPIEEKIITYAPKDIDASLHGGYPIPYEKKEVWTREPEGFYGNYFLFGMGLIIILVTFIFSILINKKAVK